MARPLKYSPEDVAKALKKANGLQTHAATILKCAPATVKSYIDKYDSVREAYQNARDGILDEAEHQLIKQVREGNITAIIFTLKTIGKHRGYVERHDIGLALSPEVQAMAQQLGINKADIVREFEALIRSEAERVNSS